MKTITTAQLDSVTGGTQTKNASSDQLLTAIQGIQSSIKDLTNNNQNQGLFGGQNGTLMFMVMALAMRGGNHTSTQASWGRGGYAYSYSTGGW